MTQETVSAFCLRDGALAFSFGVSLAAPLKTDSSSIAEPGAAEAVLSKADACGWLYNGSAGEFCAQLVVAAGDVAVRLEPEPALADIAANRVTHFRPVAVCLKSEVGGLPVLAPAAVSAHDTPRIGIPFDWSRVVPQGSIFTPEAEEGHSVEGEILQKAEGGTESTPAGSRWITVHPHGEGAKGVPVLVQEVHHGSGVFHVIGGAGGKLNYLKLKGVKSEGEYRQESAERQASARQARQAQVDQDKQNGTHEAKQLARQKINDQKREAENDFISTVAQAMGWDESSLSLPASSVAGLSDKAQKKAQEAFQRSLLARAKEAVNVQRQALLADPDNIDQAFGPDVPLVSDNTALLSVADLDPVKPVNESGIDADFKGRAEANGLTDDALDDEVAAIQHKDATEIAASKEAAQQKRDEAAKIQAEIEAAQLDKPDLTLKVAGVKQAAALLIAQKKLASIQVAARKALSDVDKAAMVEPKAYVLEVHPAAAEQAEASVKDDLRTISTRSFLAQVAKSSEESLGTHVAAGAFNSFNALSQAAGGASLMDRTVVDVLGVAGAAQVLARRLRADLGADKADQMADAFADFHTHRYMEVAGAALDQVKQLHAEAESLTMQAAQGADDVITKAGINKRRVNALAAADKVLGMSLGEMEANAALVAAMREKKRSIVQVSLGNAPLDSAVRQVRALGMVPGDYKLDRVGVNVFLTVGESGLDKLAKNVDHEGLARVRRNLDIMEGKQDENGWLPQGFANRADLALKSDPGVAQRLSMPFDGSSDDLQAALRDYIGGRYADGDAAADILSDVQSGDFFAKVGPARAEDYRAALDAVAPNKVGGKQLQRAEQLAPLFDGYANAFVQAHYGGKRSTLNAQTFDADDKAQDAAHRALAAVPEGVIAYKAIGSLTRADRAALRGWFHANVAHDSPERAALMAQYDKLIEQEPDKTVLDMFGEESANPNWSAWASARDELAGNIKASGLTWADYTKTLRSQPKAYEAVQDLIRSRVTDEFAKAYNTLNKDAPLKLGRTVIRHNLNHLDAVDPAAREERMAKEKGLMAGLQKGADGKFQSGSVKDKLDAVKEQKAAFEQAQMGFFSSDDEPVHQDKPLAQDERRTIGHAAENKLASVIQTIGGQFKPGQPVKLFHASMSGPEGIKRQRAVKMIGANERVALGFGVGSGKTGIGLGGFAQLHGEGKVKKGIFAVPSIVQGQFGAEALRFLKPGEFSWHCEPGGTRESRIASYKDPANHFTVVTHQALRDDLLHLAALHDGTTPDAVRDKLASMGPMARADYMKAALASHGINFDYTMVDEGHGLLDREGKEDSGMSHAIGAMSHASRFYVHASGDPVKNDASEAFSLLQKMDPARYSDRAAFMRMYGGDTIAAKDGLKREMARHLYTASIKPDVQVTRSEAHTDLSEGQQKALKALDANLGKIKVSKLTGKLDVGAVKAIAPHLFEGAPADQHAAIAEEVGKSAGLLRNAAERSIIYDHPDASGLDRVAHEAMKRKGKAGVVFATSRRAVENLRKRLEAEGHRVVTITGSDSSADKAAKIRAFNPDSGERSADIVVCSDAAATGANLQSGQWLMNYDTPDTAMVHAQRQGRINRIGQKNAIELIDHVPRHASVVRSRERLAKKYVLRELLTSPMEGMDDTGLASFLHGQKVEEAQGSLL
ncbi:helicase-related protein [Burkholderia sp. Ac-20349]|uniref:helicase-related protein n=1 Tax=Burkholderia sp. Ac-20349 TaxID=2703893 RepID=UPI00197CAD4C|nr:helicase-related protein [Burkholderia sp. Ac-20349]MBN3839327.1 hypothetical protein [Burkholderia sp. Ac-20349]